METLAADLFALSTLSRTVGCRASRANCVVGPLLLIAHLLGNLALLVHLVCTDELVVHRTTVRHVEPERRPRLEHRLKAARFVLLERPVQQREAFVLQVAYVGLFPVLDWKLLHAARLDERLDHRPVAPERADAVQEDRWLLHVHDGIHLQDSTFGVKVAEAAEQTEEHPRLQMFPIDLELVSVLGTNDRIDE
eukprot:640712-Prymnesium_polylepis.2